MPGTEKDNDWFDVLTGRKEPRNREELIFSELRSRVIKDADSDDYQLSELDLQRGKKALRAAAKPNVRKPVLPFLSGLAAGAATVSLGMTVFLSPIGDPDVPITKELPPGLTPSIERNLPSPESLASSATALIDILSREGIAFELDSDGSQIVLTFKTPAPVPTSITDWLTSNGVESQPVTTYVFTIATKTARQP